MHYIRHIRYKRTFDWKKIILHIFAELIFVLSVMWETEHFQDKNDSTRIYQTCLKYTFFY